MYDPNEPLPYEPFPFEPPPDDPDGDPACDPDGELAAVAGNGYGYTYRRLKSVPPNPANHGVPWTDDQHELLIERIKAGDDLEAIADAIGRKPHAALSRMRRLLPPDNREHPSDLVLAVVREYLSDPNADWRTNLLTANPPRPIITPAPIVRTGLGGIPNDDLVTIVHAMIAVHGQTPPELLRQLIDELEDRHLVRRLITERVRELRYVHNCTLSEDQLHDAARRWVDAATASDALPGHHSKHWWDSYAY